MRLSFGLFLDWQSSGLFFGVALANTAFGDPLVAFLHDRGITSVDLLAASNDGFTTCVCARPPCLSTPRTYPLHTSNAHLPPPRPFMLWHRVALLCHAGQAAKGSRQHWIAKASLSGLTGPMKDHPRYLTPSVSPDRNSDFCLWSGGAFALGISRAPVPSPSARWLLRASLSQ